MSGLADLEIERTVMSSGGAGGGGGESGTGGGDTGGSGPEAPCVAHIATRLATTCAVRSDGALFCWGRNDTGMLGNGSTQSSTLPVEANIRDVVQVALGAEFLVALRADRTVRTVGDNLEGQLGNGQSGSRQLQQQTPDVGDVVEIGAGRAHACARTAAGAVKCWGSNDRGQLGTDPVTTPFETRPREAFFGAKALAVGARHTCIIRSDDNVVCWGRNDDGQLGLAITSAVADPTPLNVQADALALGGAHTCALRDGRVRCWGFNQHWQLGDASGTRDPMPREVAIDGTVVAIAASGRKTCARLDNGSVVCWGEAGQPVPKDPTPVDPELPAVDSQLSGASLLSLGTYHQCVRRPDGRIWCRGSNTDGQLGNGFDTEVAGLVEPLLTCP